MVPASWVLPLEPTWVEPKAQPARLTPTGTQISAKGARSGLVALSLSTKLSSLRKTSPGTQEYIQK